MINLKKTLYLLPVPISEDTLSTIPNETLELVNSIHFYVVENLKTARRMLRKMGCTLDFNTDIQFIELQKHDEIQNFNELNLWMKEEYTIGLMSEAGLPCIADPGNEVVALAHTFNYTIKPHSGPTSIILALISSGFNGQNFAFNGYLPIERSERILQLKKLEQRAISETQTQLFMETPYRNMSLMEDIINTLKATTKLSIAANVLASDSLILSKTILEWKKNPLPNIHKIPTVFAIFQ